VVPQFLKRHLEHHAYYRIARAIAVNLPKALAEDRRVVQLRPAEQPRGQVLLSYRLEGFFLAPDDAGWHGHPSLWETCEIARAFVECGYAVDVISYLNPDFVPQKSYDILVDCKKNLERLAPLLPEGSLKIMHLDTSHWLYNNTMQHLRALALQERRGVTIGWSKRVTPNWGLEHAHCATMLGNEVTARTYAYAGKRIYPLPTLPTAVYPWPEEKDFERCRRSFLWLGSNGFVHKGLDLVLEVFAARPDLQLTVCGPIQQEPMFERAYAQELYHTPNIRTIGWVNTGSPEFLDIVNSCVALVYPSCAEGQSGAVVSCLHAGLIPIVSAQSGVDVDEDFGRLLQECSLMEIEAAVEQIANLPATHLRDMARRAWEFARARHTRERYAAEYRHILREILAGHWQA
jgi:glycosyltransferase involved in cell wall biosynthesis